MSTAEGTDAAPAKVRKFPCPACGADVIWSPGASRLQCPYCGHLQEVPQTAEAVAERPLEPALAAPQEVGWGTERRTVRCTRCGAVQTLDPGETAGRCAFCGTPGVVEADPSSNMVRPQGVLPFRIDRHGATGKFRTWLAGLWFRPNDLKTRAELTSITGVYVPFWTFDAATHSAWTAEAGYRYTVRSGGRTETRIRWEPASGVLEYFFDDLPVPGSRGLDAQLAQRLEPFSTAKLVDYAPEFLSGFLAEENSVPLAEAFARAKVRMTATLYAACGHEVPGDLHRNLQVRTSYSGLAYKNGLLPIWISAYQYRGKIFRFLVNGETGKTTGNAPFSWIKIALAIGAVLVAFLILSLLKN